MNLREDNDRKGLAGTILVHAIIILLMLLWGFKGPDVQDEDEGGVLVSFGEIDAGGPEETNAVAEQTEQTEESVPEEPTIDPVDDPVITNDDATAPEMVEKKQTKPVTEPPEEKKPEVDKKLQDAINKLKQRNSDKNSSSGDGTKDGPKGDPNASNSGPGGTGGGLKGSGEGVNLMGFTYTGNPVMVNDKQEFGTVELEFCVDKNGQIIESSIRVGPNSKTLSKHLINLTTQGLKKLKFSPKPGVVKGGCGTITSTYERE